MNNFLNLSSVPLVVIVVLLLWTLPWKAVALWRAAQRKDLVWFIVFFLVNTLAILEILYLFVFSRKKKSNDRSGT